MNESRRWARLFLAMLALLLAGIIYAWSFLKTPLAELYGWDPRGTQLQLNYTLTLCFFCTGGLVSGLLAKKLSIRTRMLIGGALVCAGLIIVSRLTGKSAFALYLGYGIMAGAGIGFVYNTVISTTNAWFPDKKGVASGGMMLGFGFSAMVLGNLAAKLFGTSLGWRGTYLVYGIIIGGALIIIGFVMRLPKPGETPVMPAAKAGEGVEYAPMEMIKRPSFWMLFAEFTFIGAVGSVAIGQSRDLILGMDANAATLAALGASLISVMNGIGRLFWGTLFDKIGLKKTRYIDCAVFALTPILILVSIKISSPALCFVALCLTGLAFAYAPTATTTFALAFYGRKNFSINFPVLTLTLIPAAFASTITGGMSFTSAYVFLSIVAVIGAVINAFIRKA